MALTALSQWKPFMIIPSAQIIRLDHFMIKVNKDQEEHHFHELSSLCQKRKASEELNDKIIKKIKLEEMIPGSISLKYSCNK